MPFRLPRALRAFRASRGAPTLRAPNPSGLCCAGLALLVAGCATPPPPPAPPPPPPLVCERPPVEESAAAPADQPPVAGSPPVPARAQSEGNIALLAYADRLRSLGSGEVAGEIARLNDTPDAQRGAFGDLQLAVALGQTRQPQDLQRALNLLQRLAAGNSEEARRLQPLARLIAGRYAEQRRVEDLLDKQNQAMRDSQRKLDQLNERLEAVRAIERSLTRSSGNNGSVAPATRP